MPAPTFDQWLPSSGLTPRGDSFRFGSGEDGSAISFDDAQAFYNSTFTPDSSGRLPFGTQGRGFTQGTGWENAEVAGQPFLRTGSDLWETYKTDNDIAPILQQLGISGPNYNEELGYLTPGSAMSKIDPILSKRNAGGAFDPIAKALMFAAAGAVSGGMLPGMDVASGAMMPAGSTSLWGNLQQLASGTFNPAAGASSGAAGGGAVGGGGGFQGSAADLANLSGASQQISVPGMTTIGNPSMGAIPGGSIGGAMPWASSAFDLSTLGQGASMGMSGLSNLPTGELSPEQIEEIVRAEGGYSSLPSSGMEGTGFSPFQRLAGQFGLTATSPQSFLSSIATMAGGGGGAAGGLFGGASSPLNMLMSVGSGLYGMSESEKLRKLAMQQAGAADPFGPYRGQYAQLLSQLSADPSRIFSMPGYAAGEQAIQRTMASQGYLGSGNMMAAMQKYGGDFYDKEVNRLSQLAGAQFNPANASQIAMSGQQGANDLASRSLASIGYGLTGKSAAMSLLEQLAARSL